MLLVITIASTLCFFARYISHFICKKTIVGPFYKMPRGCRCRRHDDDYDSDDSYVQEREYRRRSCPRRRCEKRRKESKCECSESEKTVRPYSEKPDEWSREEKRCEKYSEKHSEKQCEKQCEKWIVINIQN